MKFAQVFLLMLAAGLVSTAFSQTPDHSKASSPSIKGDWEGTLSIGSNRLRLVLKVAEGPAGTLKASMDSLDQPDSNDLVVDVISLKDAAVHFEMKALYIVYDGTLNSDRSEIAGTLTQGSTPLPLTFRKRPPVSTAAVQRGRVQFRLCGNAALTNDALCGKYEVYEDRVARTGRKISLNIILLPASSAKAAPDPLIFLAGGPGAAATSYAVEKSMNGLRRNRDVVLVDQRGTGSSNPLNCPPTGSREDMRGYFRDVFPAESIKSCRAQLEKIADLKLYTTSIAMDDLDEVRAALGYDRIDLYGGSYGSIAALVYVRQHQDRVRSMAIFGIGPPGAKIPLSFAKGVQDSMDRLFADCAADQACHAAYPNLVEEFKQVLSRFDKGPVEVTATNVYTGQAQQVTVTRDAFVDGIRQLLYVPAASAGLPVLIHLGAQGDLGPLVATAFQVVQQIDSRIARGMQFSVLCAEDIPFITEEDVKKTSANTFYGDARVRPAMKACAEWPRANVPASFLAPVKSDVPALLVSGGLDPVTPPWLAKTVAQTLSRGRLIVIPNATHTSYECVENLVADFIDKGTAEGLDASCVEQIKRPPFTILKGQ
jgi:pimeloyl-ACP methyl ester carboxylesterase